MFDETVIYSDEDSNFRLVWEYIGEGLYGDYDSDDSTDEPLLRFTIEQRVMDDWDAVEGASYCTFRNIYSNNEDLVNVGNIILNEFIMCYNSGAGWIKSMSIASTY